MSSADQPAHESPRGRVVLKPRRARPFFARHPWVYTHSVARVEGSPAPGDEVEVFSHEGRVHRPRPVQPGEHALHAALPLGPRAARLRLLARASSRRPSACGATSSAWAATAERLPAGLQRGRRTLGADRRPLRPLAGRPVLEPGPPPPARAPARALARPHRGRGHHRPARPGRRRGGRASTGRTSSSSAPSPSSRSPSSRTI